MVTISKTWVVKRRIHVKNWPKFPTTLGGFLKFWWRRWPFPLPLFYPWVLLSMFCLLLFKSSTPKRKRTISKHRLVQVLRTSKSSPFLISLLSCGVIGEVSKIKMPVFVPHFLRAKVLRMYWSSTLVRGVRAKYLDECQCEEFCNKFNDIHQFKDLFVSNSISTILTFDSSMISSCNIGVT